MAGWSVVALGRLWLPIGLDGRPAHARRDVLWGGGVMRLFLAGGGVMQKVGVCGKVVWRIVLECGEVVVCCRRRRVASGDSRMLLTAVVGCVMIMQRHLVIGWRQ